MAEVWQSYGSWILYGLFFILMMLLHTRMHGHGAHAGHAAGGHTANAADGSAADGHAHGDAGNRRGHHRGRCC